MSGFTFFASYFEAAECLTKEEQDKLFGHVVRYAYTGVDEDDLEGFAKALWVAYKPTVDNSRRNSGRGGRPPKEPTESDNIKTDDSCETKTEGDGADKTDGFNKNKNRRFLQNEKPSTFKDKDKEKEINNISLGHSDERPGDEEALFEELWKKCPNKRGKADVSKSQKKKLLKIGRDKMLLCLEKYSAEMRGRDPKFIPHASRFFNKLYIDYLTEDAPELKPPDNAPFVETIPDDEVFPWEKYDE